MQNDNNSKQTPPANLDDTLDVMMFGETTPQKARIVDMLEKRKLRRGGMRNQAK